MNTMKWLIKRELWEHKGMLLWAPAVVAGLLALLVAVALLLGHNVTIMDDGVPIDIDQVTMTDSVKARVVATAANFYMAASAPVFLMLGVLVFFYCLGALHDERRDRSLLFWKSLPVSDHMTVLSKAALALAVTPLITIAIGTVLSLLLLAMTGLAMAVHGTNLFGALLSSPDFYLAPLRVVGMLPVYMLWALPTVGWLLMVSSWARSKVFLWAVGIPLVAAVLLAWADKVFAFGWNAQWFLHAVVTRILLGVTPGSWFLFGHVDPEREVHAIGDVSAADVFSASWASLGTASLWIGVAAGVAMLAAAVWMRRRREEG